MDQVLQGTNEPVNVSALDRADREQYEAWQTMFSSRGWALLEEAIQPREYMIRKSLETVVGEQPLGYAQGFLAGLRFILSVVPDSVYTEFLRKAGQLPDAQDVGPDFEDLSFDGDFPG